MRISRPLLPLFAPPAALLNGRKVPAGRVSAFATHWAPSRTPSDIGRLALAQPAAQCSHAHAEQVPAMGQPTPGSLADGVAWLRHLSGEWSLTGSGLQGTMTAGPMLGGQWLQVFTNLSGESGRQYSTVHLFHANAGNQEMVRLSAGSDGNWTASSVMNFWSGGFYRNFEGKFNGRNASSRNGDWWDAAYSVRSDGTMRIVEKGRKYAHPFLDLTATRQRLPYRMQRVF